jgi:S1-C subfamily serine protease
MPEYIATVQAQDVTLDFAVLQITADGDGNPITPESLSLPFVPLGDSDAVRLADPIDILSYPLAGGDSITYTTGVVSGFNFPEDSHDRAWITTDATLSGGSSGGTALNRAGELIGVPTQGSELDCRPEDLNGDGAITAEDIGCVPVGGSIGQLRPVNLVKPLLMRVGGSNPATGYAALPLTPKATATSLPSVSGTSQSKGFVLDFGDESACANGPVYPTGTELIAGSDGYDVPLAGDYPFDYLPAGTVLRTTGPFVEHGVCDLWPVEVVSVPAWLNEAGGT